MILIYRKRNLIYFNEKNKNYLHERKTIMMSIERIRWLLKEANLKKVANVTKIPYPTLHRTITKPEISASYETVKKLSDYLNDKISHYSDD